MEKTRTFLKILTPSFASAVMSFSVAILLLLVTSGGFLTETRLINKFILGSDASPTLNHILGLLFEEVEFLLAQDHFGTMTVFLFWVFVGIGAFGIFSYAGKVFTQISDNVLAFKNTKDEKMKLVPISITAEHFVFRLGIVTLSVFYTILLERYIYPAIAASFQAGIIDGFSLSGWVYFITSIPLLAICIYVYTVLTRLFILRFRVFG